MNLRDLQQSLSAQPIATAICHQLEQAEPTLHLHGMTGSAAALYIAAFSNRLPRVQLIVLNDYDEAGYFFHDLAQVLGEEQTLFFPSSYKRAIRYGQIDPASVLLRTEVLSRITEAAAVATPLRIVSYPEALAEMVVSDRTMQDQSISLGVNQKVEGGILSDKLDELGFERVDYVFEPGQYALRGSIVDVFSYSSDLPFRIDFFGDMIDSIRIFRVESQLSVDRVDSIHIVSNLQRMEANGGISLPDFLPDDSLLLIKDLRWTIERIAYVVDEEVAVQAVQSEEYDTQVKEKLVNIALFKKRIIAFQRIEFGAHPWLEIGSSIRFDTQAQPLFHKNFDLVAQTLRQYMTEGYTIYILSDSTKQVERLRVIFEERGDAVRFVPVIGTIHEGFADRERRVCYFTDHQIFDRFHKFNLKSEKARTGKLALSLKELQQFELGDYVVHILHGIGKFGGLVRQENGGKTQEMVKLIYQNDDLVFVSIHALHRLSKYRGKDGDPPRISRLGSGTWEKIKEKTKSKVKEIARDLIKLYAARRNEKGFAFTPDTYLQQELEASFLYEDTPDQLKATAEVKEDMQRPRPMDRLICGDVGFGKTEIAIRAAFKAATDGKQVAVMVPTTVLAFQHFKTFSERLKEFPCKVDYLSRARKPSEVKRILGELKEGKIDILVGTHRLTSKDIQFKDLGLLIIDEEQKFGVAVKEKLRQMRISVDTLTMSATPIPRTLQFSLVGARELSAIQTPPPNRYPIQTEVHLYNDEIFREAINFELSRNGQVFIINNRIDSLATLQNLVKRVVPDARVAIGHGQIPPEQLEKILIDFQNYDYDVLIATTIIESGIDIPNANTIIINSAHHFGLSELHQLRGRVGRSNRKAFCYLITPPLSLLQPDSRRRLQAIENFSDLGSGIHIAMQDLDIRGAGNLLGAEQSGFIADLGYDTYQKILHEAVVELRQEEFAELFEEDVRNKAAESGCWFVDETLVETDLELLFTPDYVPNDSERISLYQELDRIEAEDELHDYIVRLTDRFGKMPQEAEELTEVVRLRRTARQLGIERIVLKNGKMTLYPVSNIESTYYQSDTYFKIVKYYYDHPRACEFRDKGDRRLFIIKPILRIRTAIQLLQNIANN